jgi:hypothetical protein
MESEASTSFLKKRRKKLLVCRGMGVGAGIAPADDSQSLFASFSSEKEGFLFKGFQ